MIKIYNAAIKLILDEVDPLKSFNEAVYASAIAETQKLNIKSKKGSLTDTKIHVGNENRERKKLSVLDEMARETNVRTAKRQNSEKKIQNQE